jgi:hypothetical protein
VPGYAGTPLIAVACATSSGFAFTSAADDQGLDRRLRDRYRCGHRRGPGPLITVKSSYRRQPDGTHCLNNADLVSHDVTIGGAPADRNIISKDLLWTSTSDLHRRHDPERIGTDVTGTVADRTTSASAKR